MEEIQIRLNDFLFNSGVLGFYRVLENAEKDGQVEIKANTIKFTKEVLKDFEKDYINAMINQYEEDTKWYSIVSKKEWIRNLDTNDNEKEKQLDEQYKFIKKIMQSNSYKAGYEILKLKQIKENPYEIIEQLKKEKDTSIKKEKILEIIEHVEENKSVYCMKDIIYTKINRFWINVSFLNKQLKDKDIEEEYKNAFVTPAIEYLEAKRKGDLNCIECGNVISKKEASGLSWINHVGVDIARKKSGFWNFNEDAYICPICKLIYSCIPLGFSMIGSNGIFVNSNENFNTLIQNNNNMITEKNLEESKFEDLYQKILNNFINRTDQVANEKISKYEMQNIQVIKRVGTQDNQKYEFNMISRDKLEILKKSNKYLEKLVSTRIYQEVLNNVINGKKQYELIDKLLREDNYINFIKNILLIQLNSMGGINVKERKEIIEQMIYEGEKLQNHFYFQGENTNKLKSYVYKLQVALKSNNVEEFMKLFTMFYGGMNILMPNCEAVKVLIEEPEYFRLLGYSYIYGIQKRLDKNLDEKGGNKDEE